MQVYCDIQHTPPVVLSHWLTIDEISKLLDAQGPTNLANMKSNSREYIANGICAEKFRHPDGSEVMYVHVAHGDFPPYIMRPSHE